MRPIRLKMTAFGPYRDAETIDFTLLRDRGLFVISGMTGAGKTTIFDAICYALYGAASGEDRSDVRMLRSHFADENVHTSVDFEFAVGNRSYRVFRQMGHRKGANKHETGGRIELYETTGGTQVPCMDKFTVPEVNAKLEEIIGLTKDQFSQIVMLPQGEFRKLLTSDTENKEEILRRIFHTRRFQRLEERFYEKSRQLKEVHEEAYAKLTVHLQQAEEALPKREGSRLAGTFAQAAYNAAQVLEGLSEERTHYKEQLASLEEERARLARRLERLEAEYRTASEGNRLLEELDAKRTRLQELGQQKAPMDELERKLKAAESAARIEPYEQVAADSVHDAGMIRLKLDAKRGEAEQAAADLEEAKRAYEREDERSPERLQLEVDIRRLRELQPAVLKLGEMRQEVARLEETAAAMEARVQELERQVQQLRGQRETIAGQESLLEEETSRLAEQEVELEQLRHKGRLLRELAQLDGRMREWEMLEQTRRIELERIRKEHERIETAWIEGQAGFLAAHLHDGEPCPVCGSREHPAKARAAHDLPSRDELMRLKEQLRIAEQEVHAAAAQAAAARESWNGMAGMIGEYGIVPGDYEDQLREVSEREKQAASRTDELRTNTRLLAELRKRRAETDRQLERLTAERDEANQALQELNVRHSRESALLMNELSRIPEHLRSQEKLSDEISGLEERLQSLNEAYVQAQERLQKAEKRRVEVEAELQSLTRQAEEAEAKAAEARKKFLQSVVQAGFADEKAYALAKMTESDRRSAASRLEEYRQTVLVLRQQIAELEAASRGREIVDLTQFETSIAAMKLELEDNAAARQRAERFMQDAERLHAAIEQASRRVRQIEEELEQILDLYQVIKGDNQKRISFERYILIDYLDKILQAANARLQRLSNGQFYLVRRDRTEARGRQSGLGLDVYDAYTGQNRDVKTLSGGEKFNASLALALGMTDVIQAHQGGVSIEMMFIDEGFGSLDEEALQKAIATLVDLQKAGRMIGVISHVNELKEAFPAVIEVTKTKEGHSRTNLIVK